MLVDDGRRRHRLHFPTSQPEAVAQIQLLRHCSPSLVFKSASNNEWVRQRHCVYFMAKSNFGDCANDLLQPRRALPPHTPSTACTAPILLTGMASSGVVTAVVGLRISGRSRVGGVSD